MNKHLNDNSPDILSLAETFLRSDDKPNLLHTGYNWFGKCRKSVKDKGGIGICVKTDFPILDDNLNSSREDDFERFWILGRLNGVKAAMVMKYAYRAILTIAAYENAILPDILYYPLTNKVITVVGFDNLLRQPNLQLLIP